MAPPSDRSASLARIEAAQAALARVTDVAFTGNPFAGLETKLCLAMTPRTGSNYLCQRLRAHGLRANNYFNTRQLSTKLAKSGERLEDHCVQLIDRFQYRRSFAVKGAIDVLAIPFLCGELPANLAGWAFVHLRRRDIVKQAISNVLARQTGAWRLPSGASSARAPAYGAGRLLNSATTLIEMNRVWNDFFSDFQVRALAVWYEDLDWDSDTVCAAIARFAGHVAPPIPGAKPAPLARQSNPVNAEWEARLRSEQPGAIAAIEARWRAPAAW